jgi:hypothetical protein
MHESILSWPATGTMSAHLKSTSSAASITVSSTHMFRAAFVVLGALCLCLWSVDLYVTTVKIPSGAIAPSKNKFAFNPERSRRLNAAGAGDGAVATPATNDAVPSTLCNVWGCTCQGFSDTFQTWPMHWGEASKNSKAKEWWISTRCATKPAAGDEDERGGGGDDGGGGGGGSQPVQKNPPSMLQPRAADVVSILTFSNGQPYCNENALLNGMYQRRPDGVSTIELVMFETSDEPSMQWQKWERLYAGPPFKVVYRWYNGSLPRGKSKCAKRLHLF